MDKDKGIKPMSGQRICRRMEDDYPDAVRDSPGWIEEVSEDIG